MARGDKPHRPRFPDLGHERAGLEREPRHGCGGVQPPERVQARPHVVAVVARVRGDLAQDALDFAGALDLGLADLVVEVQHGGGLDKDRLPRRRDVVDEALHLALGLGADRDHGAPAADGRLRLGRPALRDRVAKCGVERLAQAAVQGGEAPREVREVRARVVAHVPGLVHDARDAVFEGFEHDDLLGDLPQAGRLRLARVQVVVHAPDRREHARQAGQVAAVDERVGGPQAREDRPHVVGLAERERVVEADEVGHLAGPAEAPAHDGGVRRRAKARKRLAPVGRPGVVQEAGADGVEAQAGLGVGGVERHVGHGRSNALARRLLAPRRDRTPNPHGQLGLARLARGDADHRRDGVRFRGDQVLSIEIEKRCKSQKRDALVPV